jgi:hypothetical protein
MNVAPSAPDASTPAPAAGTGPGGAAPPTDASAGAEVAALRVPAGLGAAAPGRLAGEPQAVQRIWREEGLPVPALPPKRRRLGISTVPAARLRAERPNHVWGPEVMVDATTDGRLGARQPSVLAIWARATFLRLAAVLSYAYDGRIRYQAVSGRRRMGRF